MDENPPNFQVLWNTAQNPTASGVYDVESGTFADLLRKGPDHDSEALYSLWDKHCTVSNPDLLPNTGRFPAGALKQSAQSVNKALRECLFTDPTKKAFSLVYYNTHTRRRKRKANMMPSDSELSPNSDEDLEESFLDDVEMGDDVTEKISADLLRLRYGPGPRYPLPDASGLYPLVEAQHHRRFFLKNSNHLKAKDTYWPWNRIPDDNILGTDHLERKQWKEAPANLTVLERINNWYRTHRENLFPMEDMEDPFLNRKYSLAESRYPRDRRIPPGVAGTAQLAYSLDYLPSPSYDGSDSVSNNEEPTPSISSVSAGSNPLAAMLRQRLHQDISFSDPDKKEDLVDNVLKQLLKMFQPRYAPLGRSFNVFGVRSYTDTCFFCRKKGADMDTMEFEAHVLVGVCPHTENGFIGEPPLRTLRRPTRQLDPHNIKELSAAARQEIEKVMHHYDQVLRAIKASRNELTAAVDDGYELSTPQQKQLTNIEMALGEFKRQRKDVRDDMIQKHLAAASSNFHLDDHEGEITSESPLSMVSKRSIVSKARPTKKRKKRKTNEELDSDYEPSTSESSSDGDSDLIVLDRRSKSARGTGMTKAPSEKSGSDVPSPRGVPMNEELKILLAEIEKYKNTPRPKMPPIPPPPGFTAESWTAKQEADSRQRSDEMQEQQKKQNQARVKRESHKSAAKTIADKVLAELDKFNTDEPMLDHQRIDVASKFAKTWGSKVIQNGVASLGDDFKKAVQAAGITTKSYGQYKQPLKKPQTKEREERDYRLGKYFQSHQQKQADGQLQREIERQVREQQQSEEEGEGALVRHGDKQRVEQMQRELPLAKTRSARTPTAESPSRQPSRAPRKSLGRRSRTPRPSRGSTRAPSRRSSRFPTPTKHPSREASPTPPLKDRRQSTPVRDKGRVSSRRGSKQGTPGRITEKDIPSEGLGRDTLARGTLSGREKGRRRGSTARGKTADPEETEEFVETAPAFPGDKLMGLLWYPIIGTGNTTNYSGWRREGRTNCPICGLQVSTLGEQKRLQHLTRHRIETPSITNFFVSGKEQDLIRGLKDNALKYARLEQQIVDADDPFTNSVRAIHKAQRVRKEKEHQKEEKEEEAEDEEEDEEDKDEEEGEEEEEEEEDEANTGEDGGEIKGKGKNESQEDNKGGDGFKSSSANTLVVGDSAGVSSDRKHSRRAPRAKPAQGTSAPDPRSKRAAYSRAKNSIAYDKASIGGYYPPRGVTLPPQIELLPPSDPVPKNLHSGLVGSDFSRQLRLVRRPTPPINFIEKTPPGPRPAIMRPLREGDKETFDKIWRIVAQVPNVKYAHHVTRVPSYRDQVCRLGRPLESENEFFGVKRGIMQAEIDNSFHPTRDARRRRRHITQLFMPPKELLDPPPAPLIDEIAVAGELVRIPEVEHGVGESEKYKNFLGKGVKNPKQRLDLIREVYPIPLHVWGDMSILRPDFDMGEYFAGGPDPKIVEECGDECRNPPDIPQATA